VAEKDKCSLDVGVGAISDRVQRGALTPGGCDSFRTLTRLTVVFESQAEQAHSLAMVRKGVL
jgi:hypothetical protein